MEAEKFLELYDSCWFEAEIFKKEEPLSKISSFQANPDQKSEEKAREGEILRVPSTLSRSMSDHLGSKSSSFDCSVSPDSVLEITPKLQTILSEKELRLTAADQEENLRIRVEERAKRNAISSRRRNKKNLSKSLSELEFEEVKGFMDLGFVFSEKDKESSLVSIIPGLQRLGKKSEEEEEEEEQSRVSAGSGAVSRPYLSEAWEVLDRKRKERPLTNWVIPSLTNEIDIKDNLRNWAHIVASAVR